ncbi:MAG: Trp family transcriptional regulator [Patescibacteria group bacterium]
MPNKYKNINKLNKQTQEELFLLLVEALSGIKKIEAAKLLRDLISEQEASMIARRLKVAMLLEQGFSYDDINEAIKVSHGTIAKIQLWLQTYGDGFRAAIPKLGKVNAGDPHSLDESGWRQIKKRFPMYFWPQILLEEVVASANKKERQRLAMVLKELKDKTPLTKQLQNILGKNSSTM